MNKNIETESIRSSDIKITGVKSALNNFQQTDALAALKKSEEKYRTLFESIDENRRSPVQ